MSVEAHLLGEPRVERAGDVVRFDTRKATALLAYLALEPGAHARERLAALLWSDYPQERAYANLRRTLWSLKQGMGAAVLEIDDRSVALQAGEIQTDVSAFRAALAGAAEHPHPDPTHCAHCAKELERAVALYRGDFLEGFTLPASPPFDEWCFFERESLRRQLADALERLVEMTRGHGGAEAAISYARRWVALDPLHEPAQRLLVRLFAEAGRHAAALRQLQEYARLLDEALGVEPDAETQRLWKLVEERQLRPVIRTNTPPAERTPQHNLPADATRLVGRQQARHRIINRLRDPACWLLTLTGPGGIGKTRLATSAARLVEADFPGGTYWVPLEALFEASLVLDTIAGTLDVYRLGEETLIEAVAEALNARGRMLLILDNFEHLLPAASLPSELHARAPDVTFLVTSREPLYCYGEQEFPVTPLAVPPADAVDMTEDIAALAANEAVTLFLQQATAARPDFTLTRENAADVVELCRRLAGIPLALELAAARIKLFSPGAMLTQLARHGSVEWLRSEATDRPERHQSLRAALAWSHGLLQAEEQALFRQLAIFSGGFALGALAAVCDVHADVELILTALVDKSLVQAAPEAVNEPRFTMLVPVREYAAEQLQESADAPAIAQRHANYFVDLAERAEPHLKGPDQLEWLSRLEVELDNLRAALKWVTERLPQAGKAMQFSAALLWFWYAHGRASEGLSWLRSALGQTGEVPVQVRARALSAAGMLSSHLGEPDSDRLLQESIELSRATDDLSNLAYALSWQSLRDPDSPHSRERARDSESLFRQIGDKWGLADLLWRDGRHALWRGRDVAQARERVAVSVALFQETGDHWRIYAALITMGDVTAGEGNFQEAVGLYEEALGICHEIGDTNGMAWASHALGRTAMAMGHYGEAESLLQEAALLCRRCGWRWHLAYAHLDLGTLARLQGQYARARDEFRTGQSLGRELELEMMLVFVAQELGYAHVYAGEYLEALPAFEEALRRGLENYPFQAALGLPGLAAVAAALGEREQAARLYAAAERLRDTIIAERGFEFNRKEYARHLAVARHVLRRDNIAPVPADLSTGEALNLAKRVATHMLARRQAG